MSGGHFDHQQYRIGQIADDIQLLIENNDSKSKNEYGDAIGRNYPPEIIAKFCDAVKCLRRAQIYATRIDWLVCDDDGPNNFLERLEAELEQHD